MCHTLTVDPWYSGGMGDSAISLSISSHCSSMFHTECIHRGQRYALTTGSTTSCQLPVTRQLSRHSSAEPAPHSFIFISCKSKELMREIRKVCYTWSGIHSTEKGEDDKEELTRFGPWHESRSCREEEQHSTNKHIQ